MNRNMKKLVRDGKVAVIFTPVRRSGGWFTNHGIEELVFDAKLANLILEQYEKVQDEVTLEIINIKIDAYLKQKYPEVKCRGPFGIAWIELGEEFYIHEYEGFETIRLKKNIKCLTA